MEQKMYRIGIGYDIHKLIEGRDLIIGGVKITHEKGLLGHSDADVLIHALIDAMLGALALDDIGTLFPDTDPKYKNIDSTLLLKHVYELVQDKGYGILDISPDDLSIKAKTKEKLDAVGQKLAIEANAVVLLQKRIKKMY